MKTLKKIFIWGVSLVFVLGFFAFVDFWSLPKPPGEIVNLHGRNVHVVCTGPVKNQAKPVVWIESPGHGVTPYWFDLQQRLKNKGLGSCSYDRAGLGWSDDFSGTYSVEREVDDAIKVLTQFAGDSPIILVGHSFGGLMVRIYAQKIPERIRGIVYVDPATISLWQQGLKTGEISSFRGPERVPWPAVRLFTRLQSKPDNMTNEQWQANQLFTLMTAREAFMKHLEKGVADIKNRVKIFEQYPPPRNIKSVVISRSPDKPLFSAELDKIWFNSYHTELEQNIDIVQMITATNSDHDIPKSEPGLIVDAIESLIEVEEVDASRER